MRSLVGAGVSLEILSAAAGLYAAYCWWDASSAKIDPGWRTEPGEGDMVQAQWTTGIMKSIVASARLNKRASIWTALAVLLGAISNILATLGSMVG